ncbi:hypothetical protein [Bifidobacterium crudilactis]|uniref:hypothetical protein n=1 Tax=Bifidobacterium crudilactis TaxID=327277 RepID=UPI0026492F15|nr:hypothetical protein [Bifidobacterium crudilactis]MDN5972687.1 hypothetical protein [Bifidobacterium crudilactis]MDN6467466.1 hypothetical protein [Bifidobacterium crudilactis]MDN6523369.1 hypothetical protein [Bifidobacterium crudilactis]MDN6559006.1 hypothetical protein [Bifidobacterium crudilactis]MDN6587614.1 hypothetical protein [Bifidobacterium crudilactis]
MCTLVDGGSAVEAVDEHQADSGKRCFGLDSENNRGQRASLTHCFVMCPTHI